MDGERVWSRMDNLPPAPGDPAATSAAEYIFPMSNGSIGVITDEAWGMGFLELAAPNGKQCPSGWAQTTVSFVDHKVQKYVVWEHISESKTIIL